MTECDSRETQGRVGGKTKMLPARGPRVADRGSRKSPALGNRSLQNPLENISKIVSIRFRLAILSKFSEIQSHECQGGNFHL